MKKKDKGVIKDITRSLVSLIVAVVTLKLELIIVSAIFFLIALAYDISALIKLGTDYSD